MTDTATQRAIGHLEGRFDGVIEKLDEIARRLTAIEARLTVLEGKEIERRTERRLTFWIVGAVASFIGAVVTKFGSYILGAFK